MSITTKEELRIRTKELQKYGGKELKSVAEYAGNEYLKIGGSIGRELGTFFLDDPTKPKRR